MRTSSKGIELIKEFEGLKLEAYLCPSKVWTIGYGTTKGVTKGMKISVSQAEYLLKKDLEAFEKEVNTLVTSKINQYQFDALVSFTYNLGGTNLLTSTLLRKVNANPDDQSIYAEFLKWDKSNGKPLAGLRRRREKEGNLYFRPNK